MPTEIGLIDGTVLVVANDQERPDDIINRLGGSDAGHPGGFIEIRATAGDYRIRPEHVTHIRWVDELVGPQFDGGVA